MGTLKWYKRDPDAALSGMFELTLEERGAYNTILDLIYSRDNNLPDDDRWLAGWLRCDLRVWRRIKTRLVEAGKLYLIDGKICNHRADEEVLRGLSMVVSAAEAGRASGVSRRAKSDKKSSKNSDLDRTGVATKIERTPELTTTTTREEELEAKASRPSGDGPAPELELADEPVEALKPEHFVEAWNGLAQRAGKPTIRKLSPSRRQALRARINGHTVEDFQEVLGNIERSAFLMSERGRFCTFDWVTKAANFQKLLEGNYND